MSFILDRKLGNFKSIRFNGCIDPAVESDFSTESRLVLRQGTTYIFSQRIKAVNKTNYSLTLFPNGMIRLSSNMKTILELKIDPDMGLIAYGTKAIKDQQWLELFDFCEQANKPDQYWSNDVALLVIALVTYEVRLNLVTNTLFTANLDLWLAKLEKILADKPIIEMVGKDEILRQLEYIPLRYRAALTDMVKATFTQEDTQGTKAPETTETIGETGDTPVIDAGLVGTPDTTAETTEEIPVKTAAAKATKKQATVKQSVSLN
jgi:hypothetical protein